MSLAWTWHSPHESISTLGLSGSSVGNCVCVCVCVCVWERESVYKRQVKTGQQGINFWLIHLALIHLPVKGATRPAPSPNIIYSIFSHCSALDMKVLKTLCSAILVPLDLIFFSQYESFIIILFAFLVTGFCSLSVYFLSLLRWNHFCFYSSPSSSHCTSRCWSVNSCVAKVPVTIMSCFYISIYNQKYCHSTNKYPGLYKQLRCLLVTPPSVDGWPSV